MLRARKRRGLEKGRAWRSCAAALPCGTMKPMLEAMAARSNEPAGCFPAFFVRRLCGMAPPALFSQPFQIARHAKRRASERLAPHRVALGAFGFPARLRPDVACRFLRPARARRRKTHWARPG